jgi:acetyltransferase
MMERTKINIALKGVRGRKSVDMAGLEQILVKFSQLIAEQPWIQELDINPLLASPDQILALDARVVVFGKYVTEEQLPKLAIRPYPSQYVAKWIAKSGEELIIRPIRPEDEPLLAEFHQGLSDHTVYLRYHYPMQLLDRVSHERLSRICHIDYDRVIALVAERTDLETSKKSILAAARLSKVHGLNAAKFSVLVTDCCQGMGIGRELVEQLIRIARDEKLDSIEAIITPDNKWMMNLAEKLGFEVTPSADGSMISIKLTLK